MTSAEVLDLEFKCGDLRKTLTIREYLKELLRELWSEGEGFSGKRPFGNSGWQYDLYQALVANKAIEGSFDPDGYLEEFDRAAAREMIAGAIKQL